MSATSAPVATSTATTHEVKPKEAPRRSNRFLMAPGSPGRRCVPCHHEKVPDPSSLKEQLKDGERTFQGFYSKASLDMYLKKTQQKPRSARRRRLRKKVKWSSTLEW